MFLPRLDLARRRPASRHQPTHKARLAGVDNGSNTDEARCVGWLAILNIGAGDLQTIGRVHRGGGP